MQRELNQKHLVEKTLGLVLIILKEYFLYMLCCENCSFLYKNSLLYNIGV